jgi:hypothetical protein
MNTGTCCLEGWQEEVTPPTKNKILFFLLILVTVHHLSVLFEQETSRTMNLDVSNYSNYPIFHQALKHGGGQIWVQEDQHPAQSLQVKSSKSKSRYRRD